MRRRVGKHPVLARTPDRLGREQLIRPAAVHATAGQLLGSKDEKPVKYWLQLWNELRQPLEPKDEEK